MNLTVRQQVNKKANLKQIGRSIIVLDFEPAGGVSFFSCTAEGLTPSSPTTAKMSGTRGGPVFDTVVLDGSTAAAAGGGGRDGGEGRAVAVEQMSDCMVFVHNRVSLYLYRQCRATGISLLFRQANTLDEYFNMNNETLVQPLTPPSLPSSHSYQKRST